MNVVIDIHTHVLPGLDDGPKTMEETDALLRRFRQVGVDKVICTPHYGHPSFDVTKEQINDTFHEVLSNRPPDESWPELMKGAEVRLSRYLIDDIRNRSVPTLGDTRFVLVEFASAEISYDAMELVHELVVRDYKPIMAHPERNVAIQKDHALLNDLIDAGVLMQITASCYEKPKSLSSPAVQLAWKIREQNHAHFIASDAHDTVLRPPCPAHFLRGFSLSEQGELVNWERTST